MSYEAWAEGDGAPWSKVNQNMASLGQGFLFGERHDGHTGLTVGYHGGDFDGNAVADGTVALTDNTTNYIVVHRSTRAVTSSTATTNWNDTTTYGRMARAVFASGVLTWRDERRSVGGIFDHSASGGGAVVGPASSTDSHFAQFDGVTGKLLKDGIALDVDDTLAADSDTRVPSQQAVKAYVDDAVSGLGSSGITWNAQTGTSYTLVLGDANNGVTMDNGSANTLTVPPNSSVAVPVGSSVVVAQKGAGQTTIDAGVGVTLLVDASLTLDMFAQYSVVSLLKIATDTWIVAGSLTPVDETTAIQQNIQSAAYTLVLADRGKCIHHPASDANNRTFTIPANSSVAYDVGTVISFSNEVNTVTIAITTDTLTWAADNSSGSRSLAAGGVATAMKVTSTKWLITGVGLT